MGYLIKTEVMDTLREDMETSMMCYTDEKTRAVVRFCYESMEKELDVLAQYRLDNVSEMTDKPSSQNGCVVKTFRTVEEFEEYLAASQVDLDDMKITMSDHMILLVIRNKR